MGLKIVKLCGRGNSGLTYLWWSRGLEMALLEEACGTAEVQLSRDFAVSAVARQVNANLN